MAVDPSQVRKRMRRNLLLSPGVVLPVWLGLTVFLVSAAVGAPAGFFGLAGLAGIALGVGVGAFRWTFGREKLRQGAETDLERETERNRRAYMRQLFRRLREDEDPRTDRYLKSLEGLHAQLEQIKPTDRDVHTGILPEVRRHAEELYASCVTSLERTLGLWQTAHAMTSSEARQQLLDSREELLDEIGKSIDHLGLTLAHFQTSGLRAGQDETLAQMRDELQTGLEVARRVEARMDRLQQELQGSVQTPERDG